MQGYGKGNAGLRERQCRATGKVMKGYGKGNAGLRERQCRATGKVMQGYGKGNAGLRERQCRATGKAMQGYGKSNAGLRERQCRATGKAMQGYGKDMVSVKIDDRGDQCPDCYYRWSLSGVARGGQSQDCCKRRTELGLLLEVIRLRIVVRGG
ncbi:hypothetical protein Btru_065527 [Bulinus truncatus]|nr:hypothetical protein Btru_065527 [Bulinus truncatus]